jgi:hypothetical protein
LIPIDLSRYFYEALTRHNYFPNQKENESELPPCFSTRQFTPEIADILCDLNDERCDGYDNVQYAITRHNNVPRRLGLIHPKPYSLLTRTMASHREEILEKSKSNFSKIKPEEHADGRILIMNYEEISEKILRIANDSFGMRFRVHSDISGCFQSIYSHSIPWAVIGFDEAKKLARSKNKDDHWSGQLDKFVRMSKRNETLGIPIGPGTSSIIVELILGAVDRELEKCEFEYDRYIDDYTCYCETHEKAKDFVRRLSAELDKFKLNINLTKTKIIELPEPENDSWVVKLTQLLPTIYIDKDFTRRELTLFEAQAFLEAAIKLNKETPDGSVLKYAVKTLIPNLSDHAITGVLNTIINLAWHYPIIIPHLESLLSNEEVDASQYTERINKIIIENAKNGRSDGMAWCIYYLLKFDLNITESAFQSVIESNDCISILLLSVKTPNHPLVIKFAEEIIDGTDYQKDQYWLLLYQLFFNNYIKMVYKNDVVFDTLKKYNVNFLPGENEHSIGEKYCDYINNPFDDSERDSFLTWTEKA